MPSTRIGQNLSDMAFVRLCLDIGKRRCGSFPVGSDDAVASGHTFPLVGPMTVEPRRSYAKTWKDSVVTMSSFQMADCTCSITITSSLS